jgi:hypothetical protein
VDRQEELLSAFPTEHVFSNVPNTWHSQALHIYGNWLNYVIERKVHPRRRPAPSRSSTISCRLKMAGQNIRFTDAVIGKKR